MQHHIELPLLSAEPGAQCAYICSLSIYISAHQTQSHAHSHALQAHVQLAHCQQALLMHNTETRAETHRHTHTHTQTHIRSWALQLSCCLRLASAIKQDKLRRSYAPANIYTLVYQHDAQREALLTTRPPQFLEGVEDSQYKPAITAWAYLAGVSAPLLNMRVEEQPEMRNEGMTAR